MHFEKHCTQCKNVGMAKWWAPWRKAERSFTAPVRHAFDGYTPIDQMFRSMYGSSAAGLRVSREEALAVPAVQQGARMIRVISTLPLAEYRIEDNERVDSPLLRQIDPDIANVVTLAQTVDDLLFEGISWWRVTARDFAGFPVAARHLQFQSVVVQQNNGRSMPAPLPSGIDPRGATVYVDGVQTPWSDLIRFDSPEPPLCAVAGNAVRRALAQDAAANMYAANPKPLDYFREVEGALPMTDEDQAEFLNDWRAMRRQRGTGFVPPNLEYHEVAAPTPQELQLVELSREASLDLANALGVDPEDVGVSTTSRTYANAAERRLDRVNVTLSPYMRAITDRLSMGDVTRRGYVVRFDLDAFLRGDAASRWSMYSTAVGIGAMTVNEVRAAEGLPPLDEPVTSAEPTQPDSVSQADATETEEVEASERAQHTFSDRQSMTFDVELHEFSVDMDARTISGLAVPYNRLAKGVTFAPGSLKWSDPSRVKLLRDHDPRQPLGYATALTETAKGLQATFKVGTHAAGDEALLLAADRVMDGLSIGVDFDLRLDTTPSTKFRGASQVNRADLRETSIVAVPAFDDARVVKVTASREGEDMPDVVEPVTPATAPEQSNAQFAAFLEWQNAQQAETERPAVVNPTRPVAFSVNEPQAYRFDRGGNFVPTEYDFATDLHAMALARDTDGSKTDAGKRVFGLLRAAFDVDSADVTSLNPTIDRPDLYVDDREKKQPLFTAINKGAPPNGINPFRFPKFATESGLVGPHTQGVEPTGGTVTTTDQTVTPTAISGKAYLTRETWDMGGNPAVSTLIWNRMLRGYRRGLEAATATFLNTLTAAADISLIGVDAVLAEDWEAELAALQFAEDYDFDVFALHQALYTAFSGARDEAGRPLYPILGPQNANGTATSRFRKLDLAGVEGIPAPALTTKSWLFDRSTVHGWATAPQRLEFPGGSDDNTTYQPVAKVGIGIWGYSAFANSDIKGVREVTYSFS